MATPHESEIQRNLAEARRLDAESAKFAAEVAKLAAEADEARARAQQAAVRLEVERISAEREQEKRRRELAAFERQHIFLFTEPVRADSCARCVHELNHWRQTAPGCDIEIMFDSPGGSVFDGLALFDYIQETRRAGHHVTTSTRGMASSMAGILLQAGDRRVMGAEAWILIHEISTLAGGKIGEIEDEVELVKKIQERVLDIFAERSNLSKATLRRRWRRRDWWIDSSEALRLGLVDEVR